MITCDSFDCELFKTCNSQSKNLTFKTRPKVTMLSNMVITCAHLLENCSSDPLVIKLHLYITSIHVCTIQEILVTKRLLLSFVIQEAIRWTAPTTCFRCVNYYPSNPGCSGDISKEHCLTNTINLLSRDQHIHIHVSEDQVAGYFEYMYTIICPFPFHRPQSAVWYTQYHTRTLYM